MPLIGGPVDWNLVDLVVFDLDGTLYDQNRLRARMLVEIGLEVIRSRSLQVPIVLREFRQTRETLGNQQAEDFANRQYVLTADKCAQPEGRVRELVEKWIEKRPLDFIGACGYSGVQQLFEALRAANKLIAIFSDYPATAKLGALRLTADIVVCATDEDVGQLKPGPKGLHKILADTISARTLMIGDRPDRDWEAAHRVGVRAFIRSRHALPNVDTFRSYSDPMFQLLLQSHPTREPMDNHVF